MNHSTINFKELGGFQTKNYHQRLFLIHPFMYPFFIVDLLKFFVHFHPVPTKSVQHQFNIIEENVEVRSHKLSKNSGSGAEGYHSINVNVASAVVEEEAQP